MFLRSLFIACLGLSSVFVQGQTVELSGELQNALTHNQLADAAITLLTPGNQTITASSASDGSFRFSSLQKGRYTIVITNLGFMMYTDSFDLVKSTSLKILLSPSSLLKEEVIVNATRAADRSAGTFTNLNKKQLNEQNLGQDFPFLLNLTPSVVVNSDAGAGVGYTGLSIRGVDQTRINVTINGIPVNDAESQGVFWVNMPDLASSLQSVQIQRGVGTSTNGAAAFGSSINLQTNSLQTNAYSVLSNSYGSFNTIKNNIQIGTGLLKNGWSFDGRLSRISSDGFIDRASSDLRSYYLSAGYYGKKSMIKLVHFAGKEKTYQAWNGIPENVLDTNRTYNEFTYPNQTDNYQQEYYQAFYTHEFTKKLLLSTAIFYTRGKGYYEEFKTAQLFSNYNAPNPIIGADTITSTDLVRRRWLDNDFYGTTFSLQYQANKATQLLLGGGANYYDGRHFGEVIWAQFSSTIPINTHYYHDNGYKTDITVYGKANHQFKRLNLFADLQYRLVDYSFLGYDQNLKNIQQQATFNFFNPKAGLVYLLNDSSDLYLSYSVAGKEPNRNDFVNSTALNRPKAERLQDVEFGWRKKWKRASLSANVYYMYYTNQLILTGKINDVGAYTRINTPTSSRNGIELAGAISITRHLAWTGNITLSQNKIKNFTEYVDDYDSGTQQAFTHTQTDLAFSPAFIGASQFRILPIKHLTIDLISKYVSDQYLDNTQQNSRKLDGFLVNNLLLAWDQEFAKPFRHLRISLLINNLLAQKYEPNGYTFSGISGGVRSDYNYYFPQAGRNYLLQLTLGF